MNNLLESLFRRSERARARRIVDHLWTVPRIGLVLVLGCQTPSLFAHEKFQQETPPQVAAATRKLPSAEKGVGSYLKAVGGKKRMATIREGTYQWTLQLKNPPVGAP